MPGECSQTVGNELLRLSAAVLTTGLVVVFAYTPAFNLIARDLVHRWYAQGTLHGVYWPTSGDQELAVRRRRIFNAALALPLAVICDIAAIEGALCPLGVI